MISDQYAAHYEYNTAVKLMPHDTPLLEPLLDYFSGVQGDASDTVSWESQYVVLLWLVSIGNFLQEHIV